MTGSPTPTPTTSKTFVGAPPAELAARTAATSLRNLLRLNTEFSLLTGTIGAVAAGPLSDLFGLEQTWILRSLGVAVVGFGLAVFVIAGLRTSALRTESAFISAADLSWVLGTVVVVGGGWLSTTGSVVATLVAVPVLALGVAQLRARSRLGTAIAAAGPAVDLEESPPVEAIRVRRTFPLAADRLWPVMTDHELYAELAGNLGSAEAITANGPGLQRVCHDTRGRSWSETCTLWDPGRRFDIAVATDAADYPYPLTTMEGSWAVAPLTEAEAGHGAHADPQAEVTMAFAFQPKPGLAGRLFVPIMHLLFRPILSRILTGWGRAALERTPAN